MATRTEGGGGKLSGKVAIVTGASKGIGRAICVELAQCGYHIIVNYKSDDEGASQTLEKVKKEGSNGRIMRFDVANYDETQNAMDDILKSFASIDVLVNNASLTNTERHFLDADEEWWNRIIAVNLSSAFLCGQRAANIMARKGSGVIINGGFTRLAVY